MSSDRTEHRTFTVASTLLLGGQMEKLKLEWASGTLLGGSRVA